MLVCRFTKVIAVLGGLIGKATSIAPRTRALPDDLDDQDFEYLGLDHGLHRRQNRRLTSGTLTITVAPDQTCGFDTNEDAVSCPRSKRCSWESGRINHVFCDLRYIQTTCLDRTDALDPDRCDLDCLEDVNTLRCTASSKPYCLPVEFSGSISDWICHSTSSYLILFSTLDMEPRDFTTVVLVDGSPVTSWTNGISPTGPSRGTITVTSQPSQATETKPPPPGVNVGAVVGGVFGGLAFVSLVVIGVMLILRRNRKTAAPRDPLPDYVTQSNMPHAKAMAGSPTLTQPYSPTLRSPVQSQHGGMAPQVVGQYPEAYGTVSPSHQSMSTHELAGGVGDHQAGSSPRMK